jgi:hypothetical protein
MKSSIVTPGQVNTHYVSAAAIMRTDAFRRGVEERRLGREPNYDQTVSINAAWNYERGRQWAVVAPPGLPVLKDNRVNPEALLEFRMAGII